MNINGNGQGNGEAHAHAHGTAREVGRQATATVLGICTSAAVIYAVNSYFTMKKDLEDRRFKEQVAIEVAKLGPAYPVGVTRQFVTPPPLNGSDSKSDPGDCRIKATGALIARLPANCVVEVRAPRASRPQPQPTQPYIQDAWHPLTQPTAPYAPMRF